jgi:hypothetical protein
MLMKHTSLSVDEVTIRTVFGAAVDVSGYYDIFDEDTCESKQTNGTFIKFGWYDISELAYDDEKLENRGVKHKQNTIQATEDMSHSIFKKGWDSSYFPPIVSTNGKIMDGRTRIRVAIRDGQKYIPCAIFEYEKDKSVRTKNSNGVKANYRDAATAASMNDFVTAGVDIILKGEMKNDLAEIEDWLYNEMDITQVFSNNNGIITKIINQIMDSVRRNRNGQVLLTKDRKEWLPWLEESLNRHAAYYRNKFGIQSMDDFTFYQTGGNKDAMTFCEHILPNAADGIVTNIVLYSMDPNPDNAAEDHRNYIESIEKYEDYMYSWINREISGVKISKPQNLTPLWRVIGVIPQFLESKHHRKLMDNYMLASMDDVPGGLNSLFNAAP